MVAAHVFFGVTRCGVARLCVTFYKRNCQFNKYYRAVSGKSVMPSLRRYINIDGAGPEYMPHILSQHVSQMEVYLSHLSTSSSTQDDIDWTHEYINIACATNDLKMNVPNVSDIQLTHKRELSKSEWRKKCANTLKYSKEF